MTNEFMQYLRNIVALERKVYEEDELLGRIETEINTALPAPPNHYGVRFRCPKVPFIIVLAVSLFIALVAALNGRNAAYLLLCPLFALIYLAVCTFVLVIRKGNCSRANANLDRMHRNVCIDHENKRLGLIEMYRVVAAEKSNTQQVLMQYYEKNLIYPKYRTIEAVCTIYEYLESGICTELTGYTGAYNMLEAEARANRICLRLDSIQGSLNRIEQNQRLLYQAVKEGFEQTNSLLERTLTPLQGIQKSVDAQGNYIMIQGEQQRQYLSFIAENSAIAVYCRENYANEQRMARWLMDTRGLR